MASRHRLERATFEHSRAEEYFTLEGLAKQTGRGFGAFADVVVKELVDNALDACEKEEVDPEIGIGVEERGGHYRVTVSDNGPGLDPDVIKSILNFNTRTSDKAAYRSPTRGAQGNALKTVLGMPHALESEEPVIIESEAVKHTIRLWIDPAGELRKSHKLGHSPVNRGTKVTVALPARYVSFDQDDLLRWARAFALLNPHADVKIEGCGEASELANSFGRLDGVFYIATDPKQIKYRPGNPTSPHWYSNRDMRRLVHSHIGKARGGGQDLYLGQFVAQFDGLKGSAKQKQIRSAFPGIERLSDFEDRPEEEIDQLLAGMKHHAREPKPQALGALGEKHVRHRFEEFYDELHRFKYKAVRGKLSSGLPYTFEFAVAEIEDLGDIFFGVNYSPTFGDPLWDLRFSTEIHASGVENFVEGAFAHPRKVTTGDPDSPLTAVLAHIVTPAPTYLEYGKTRLDMGAFKARVEKEIGECMYSLLKPYHKEGKRRVREKAKKDRPKPQPKGEKVSLKEAVFEVLPDAVQGVSSDGRYRYSARHLYYRVRKLIQAYTDAELSEGYFRDDLLQQYQRDKGKLRGLYYEPRGEMHEPHDGTTTDLGTREVESYRFPPHLYNKILFVEKRGLFPILQDARLMERYDMAIMTSQGVATTAARTLLENADKGQKVQIFVLSDADHYGYNIAHTLRESTERMPEYSVEVIGIGLTVELGLQRGIEPENYTRKVALYERVLKHLDPESPAWEFFGADRAGEKNVPCQRIELNALSPEQTVELIEDQLRAAGVYGKVVPPAGELPELAEGICRDVVRGYANEALEEMLDWSAIKEALADEFMEAFKLDNAERYIGARFKKDDSLPWKDALRNVISDILEAKHADALKDAVREAVLEALKAGEER